MERSLTEEVERYVRTGEHDNHLFVGWPGSSIGARSEHGHAALGSALVAEVRNRTPRATVPDALRGLDVQAFARAKLTPMVSGLFSRSEQRRVLDRLARSVWPSRSRAAGDAASSAAVLLAHRRALPQQPPHSLEESGQTVRSLRRGFDGESAVVAPVDLE